MNSIFSYSYTFNSFILSNNLTKNPLLIMLCMPSIISFQQHYSALFLFNLANLFLSICKKFIISHLFFDSFSQIISYNFWQWQSLYNVLSFHVSLRRYRKFFRQIYHKIYSSVVCLKVFELVFWLVWHNVTYRTSSSNSLCLLL